METLEREYLKKALDYQLFRVNRHIKNLSYKNICFSSQRVLVLFEKREQTLVYGKPFHVYKSYYLSFQLNAIIDYLFNYGNVIDFSSTWENTPFSRLESYSVVVLNEVLFHWGKHMLNQATIFCGKHSVFVRSLRRKLNDLYVCRDNDKEKVKLASIVIDVITLKSKHNQIKIYF